MKKLLFLLMLAFSASIFASCSDDDKDDNGKDVSAETISAKWLVNGSGDYKSFEFNKSGNYIVEKTVTGVKSTGTPQASKTAFLFGTYQINGNTITLSDLGTITVTELRTSTVNLEFKANGAANPVAITATKKAEMNSTTRTDLLCRTWEIVSVDGKNVKGTISEGYILFSRAGTYYVELVNPEDEDAGGLAEWKWKDSEEEMMKYSWSNWEEDGGEVKIMELTEDKLVVLEVDEDEETTIVLKPRA